jgi:hypothetical protein
MISIAKYITVFILAFTLVNPVCCCSWSMFFASYVQDQDENISYSCCGGSTKSDLSDANDKGDPVSRDGQKNCHCALKKKFIEAEFSDFTFVNTFPIVFAQAQLVEVVNQHIERKCYGKLIAYHNPPPPATPKRILFSTYLL